MSSFTVRTDLALEDRERIGKSGGEIHGVILEEEERQEAQNAAHELGGSFPDLRRYDIPFSDTGRALIVIGKAAPTPAKYPRRWAKITKQPL